MGRGRRQGRATVVVVVLGITALSCSDDGNDLRSVPASTRAPVSTAVATTGATQDSIETATTRAPATTLTTVPAATAPATDMTPTTGPATSGTIATTAPVFAEQPCDPVPTEPARVTCGYLEVPEHHGAPGGATIRMAVAIVEPAGAPAGPEPVVFLAGGPGYGSLADVELMLERAPSRRTVVLLDYRGVGRSQPSLSCPENDDLAITSLGLPGDDPGILESSFSTLKACRDRLIADGIDLAAYNYEEIAADIEALRRALGYQRWDLWGLSNGGRVALEVVRRHPSGVRSLVLDAPSPPQDNLLGDLWSNAQRAFDHLFDRCAADGACGAAFPDLRATYERLVQELRERPVEVVVPGGEGGFPDVPVLYTDTLVLNALRTALYESALIPVLPFYINELAHGRGYDVVGQLIVDRSSDAGFSDGMAESVNCREEISFLSGDHFARQAEELPLFAPVLLGERWAEFCAMWGAGAADASFDEPVISDIPALILEGEFDPVHPTAGALRIRDDGLSAATVVELPGIGHGSVFVDACPASLVAQFLDDPSSPVDTSCVADMPDVQWVVP